MSESGRTTIFVQRVAQPFRLQLIRGQKGGYGWKIDVSAGTRDELLYEVDFIDTYLRGRYVEGQTRTALGPHPSPSPSASSLSQDPYTRMEKAFEGAKRAAEKDLLRGE